MRTFVFQQLYERGYIGEESLQNILSTEEGKPVSLHMELKLMMYAGIILLTTGLGIIVYKNIDSLNHLVIVMAIAVAAVFCFVFSYIKSPRFTTKKVAETNLLKDYILLTGCLLMLILTAYLQFQYNLFGDQYGLATFVPMLILFVCAYYFDHLGVLSMAVTNLAAWAGISVTPKQLLRSNDFNDSTLIYTAIVLGLFLLFVSFISQKKNIKSHFSFTYKNFGVHILFIAAVAAIIHFRVYELLWLVFLAAISFWHFSVALREKSFYFFVIVFLYFYFGCSYIIISRLFRLTYSDSTLYIVFLYFIATAVLSVNLLMKYNKKMKANDHLQ